MQTRIEKKYLLSEEEACFLEQAIQGFFEKDSYAGKKSFSYPVFTQYFDTAEYDFFYQKVEGFYEHLKCRVRTYSDAFTEKDPVFVELKYKEGERQYKYRESVSLEVSECFARIFANEKIFGNPSFSHLPSVNLFPVCNVFYKRNAYETWCKGGFFRINFDRDLLYLPSELKNIRSSSAFYTQKILQPGQCLLEIKSLDEFFPDDLSSLLRAYSLQEISFSKYAEALMRLGAPCSHLS